MSRPNELTNARGVCYEQLRHLPCAADWLSMATQPCPGSVLCCVHSLLTHSAHMTFEVTAHVGDAGHRNPSFGLPFGRYGAFVVSALFGLERMTF